MYFSYLLKFLFKISSNGPSNLLKLYLSMLTTSKKPSATTLAALGVFFNKANSPK